MPRTAQAGLLQVNPQGPGVEQFRRRAIWLNPAGHSHHVSDKDFFSKI